jgi:hypothetical protein
MERSSSVANLQGESDHQSDWKQDPRYLLVQRILATPDFSRSPQLAKFLFYISTASLEGRDQNLSEQHIGVAVFGRAPDYDSAADTIVRSHALRLRRRLEQYFQRAGRDEPIQLIIPRGGYAPVFLPAPDARSRGRDAALATHTSAADGASSPDTESRHASDVLSSPVPQAHLGGFDGAAAAQHFAPNQIATAPPRSSLVWRYRVLTGALAALLILVAVAFGVHLRSHLRLDRRHILWGRLFTDDQPTQIVLGDSGLVLFHAVARRRVSLRDYLNNDYSKQMPFVEHVDPKFGDFLLHRRYTSMVDATTLAHLLRLPEAVPERTLVHYSRDMHIEDFNSGNIIMIGSQEAVPWVELFETHMDFVMSIDNPDKHTSFLNRHPQKGERGEYSISSSANGEKVYGVIAFLPNLNGTGNVLLLEGLSMAGTEATVDLAIDDDHLLPILRTMRRPNGSLPYFEMLLESDTVGEGAGPARVVAVHIHS